MSAESDAGSYVVSPRFWTWLGARQSLVVLLWLLALGVGGYLLWHAYNWFNSPSNAAEERRRADGNSGHTQIDFGGQWIMGRMLVCGYGRELYHRQRQWEIAWAAFPVEDEAPVNRDESIVPGSFRVIAKPGEDLRHDANKMLSWFMGADPEQWRIVGGAVAGPMAVEPFANPFFAAAIQNASANALTPEIVETVNRPSVGGPLYPPIHAFFYAPLGLFEKPQQAYRVFQIFIAVVVILTGLGIKILSRGRIWWSFSTLVLFLYPGTRAGLDLGQNPNITLAIAVWGWVLASRGYNVAGGIVWGLLGFKPVWALALFIVPVMTRRWRFCIAMVLTGIGLAAMTLPFVGLQTWFDWLAVGKEASALYNVNHNWIMLSRDLHGIPRRILHDFSIPEPNRDTPLANALAWSLWGTVLLLTIGIYLRYGDRKRSTGVGVAFLFFGAFLTCYRFMYYDALLSAIGFAVLLSEPMRYLRTRTFGLSLTPQSPTIGGSRKLNPPSPASNQLGSRLIGYINSFPLSILVILLFVENSVGGMELQATLAFGYYARVTTGQDGATGLVTPQLVADTGSKYPMETYLILAIWIWCGIQLILGAERGSDPEKAHQGQDLSQ